MGKMYVRRKLNVICIVRIRRIREMLARCIYTYLYTYICTYIRYLYRIRVSTARWDFYCEYSFLNEIVQPL